MNGVTTNTTLLIGGEICGNSPSFVWAGSDSGSTSGLHPEGRSSTLRQSTIKVSK